MHKNAYLTRLEAMNARVEANISATKIKKRSILEISTLRQPSTPHVLFDRTDITDMMSIDVIDVKVK